MWETTERRQKNFEWASKTIASTVLKLNMFMCVCVCVCGTWETTERRQKNFEWARKSTASTVLKWNTLVLKQAVPFMLITLDITTETEAQWQRWWDTDTYRVALISFITLYLTAVLLPLPLTLGRGVPAASPIPSSPLAGWLHWGGQERSMTRKPCSTDTSNVQLQSMYIYMFISNITQKLLTEDNQEKLELTVTSDNGTLSTVSFW